MNTPSVRTLLLLCFVLAGGVLARSQTLTITGTVVSASEKSKHSRSEVENVALWLVPMNPASQSSSPPPITAKMVQKNKAFQPRLLVLPAGSAVEFPNDDPFFHNVFSLFNGKRFDLGLYEAGDSKRVHFDRVGVSYIFCNIHPEMSAVIVTVSTPYYASTDSKGNVSIKDVPEGAYELHVFADGLSTEAQKAFVRRVSLRAGNASLGTIQIPSRSSKPHKNKYGREYENPSGTPYEH